MLKWSKFIPHSPTVKQAAALSLNSKELLFGGALGGGKSDFLLMGALQYCDVPGYAAAIFRKQLTDLKQPGALIDRAKAWLAPYTRKEVPKEQRVTWVASEHSYYFPTWYPDGTPGAPARLQFCYCTTENARDRYQSAEFQYIAFDEVSHWESPIDWEFMSTRLRNTICGEHSKEIILEDGKKQTVPDWHDDCMVCQMKRVVPLRLRGATNPGGAGGTWLKKRFQIIPDPDIYPDKRDAMLAISEGTFVPFVGTHPTRHFIPSYVSDNPHLNQEEYDKFLNALPEGERSRLRDGNWESRADSRFNRRDVRYYDLFDGFFKTGLRNRTFAEFKKIFVTVDVASTVKHGPIDYQVRKGAPASTVISTWGVSLDNDLFWLDMKCFRDEVPRIVEEVQNVYLRYNPKYVKVETNGVGIGPAQYIARMGIPVKKNVKSTDKLENSTCASLLMKAGKIYFPLNVDWIEEAEGQVFNWTGLPTESDDIIDTLSDAANEIGPLKDIVDKADDVQDKNVVHYVHTRPKINLTPHLNAKGAKPLNPTLSTLMPGLHVQHYR